ncbi:hypothetical protein FRB99_007671 [Tulasnella sp. 403]|nr:hypothetical protein FRB99_007671 [Tulasnella sp. 403]
MSPSLSSLPFDVFHRIAVSTVDSTPGPPTSVRSLLLTSRPIHDSLSIENNPSFYGQIFDIQFDTAALRRRFHPSRLTAICRARELQKRWTALKRIRMHARGRNAVWGYPGYPGIYTDRDKLCDAWLAFLMLTENDGQNARQLQWADITSWTRSFIYFDIHTVSVRAQATGNLPLVTDLRALGLWLYWMTTRFDEVQNEAVNALSKVNRMLRPFTFASWAYPSFFAPWQLSHVPPPSSYSPSDQQPDTTDDQKSKQQLPPTPVAADPQPPQPATFYRPNFLPPTIVLPTYLGHPLPLTPPLVNHAAALLFFTRMQRYRLGQDAPHADDLESLRQFRATHGPDAPYTPSHSRTKFVGGVGSEAWDEEILRLGTVCKTLKTRAMWRPTVPQVVPLAPCSSTSSSGPSIVPSFDAPPAGDEDDVRGMRKFRYVPGSFSGDWEGRFVIYGLDAHQNVAQGAPGLQALESTVLTQDPQAWRLREYHHPSVLRSRTRVSSLDVPIEAQNRPPIRPAGAPLKAFIPAGVTHTPVRGGILVTSSAHPGEPVFYAEVAKRCEEDEDEGDWEEEEPTEESLVGRDDVDVFVEGEAIVPVHALEGRQNMMEVGSKVFGTIRRWDGLVTLLATPKATPTNAALPTRLQWLYRGYLTANGNWVGRWRDTWNDVNKEGYEGVFVMTKRR